MGSERGILRRGKGDERNKVQNFDWVGQLLMGWFGKLTWKLEEESKGISHWWD